MYYKGEKLTTIRKFLDYCQDPKNECEVKPYRRFALKEWMLAEADEDLQEFYVTCGPFITHLELTEPVFDDARSFRKVVFTAFPNLQYLLLKDHQMNEWDGGRSVREGTEYVMPPEGEQCNLTCLYIDMNHEHIPLSWLDLLSHFPNLDNIRLYNAEGEELEKMLSAAKIIRTKHKKKLDLKQLDILSA